MENNEQNIDQALDVASLAGHILLENGADISRVEETMNRIATHYGADSKNFFILSNGIFTTSGSHKYAKVEFIPFKGSQLDKVVEVNQLSRDITAGKYSVGQARERLEQIRCMPPKPKLEQMVASALGSAGFCAIFGGGLGDCAVSFVAGFLLYAFVLYFIAGRCSKIVSNILGGAFVTVICILAHRLGLCHSLGNVMVGAIIPLVPGVSFVNGIRDLANEDYIAGTTRVLDAILVFLCIAAGVCLMFYLDGAVFGGIILLKGMTIDPVTATLVAQLAASFVGTIGFAVIFGVPRKLYLECGIVGTLGWVLYMVLLKYCGWTIFASTLCSTMLVGILAKFFAVFKQSPMPVFLISGIFPLVPGGGIFWTSYYIVSNQFPLAVTSGTTALKVTLGIVLGIILISWFPARLFRHLMPRRHPGSMTGTKGA